jgi:hypothetical protein|nr:hypothetical protein [uncultured Lachnoclostridium sp.]
MADVIKRKVLLLHAKGSSGISKKSNQPYSMLNIEFLNSDNLNPIKNADSTELGLNVAKESLPYEKLGNITEAPAFYEIHYELGVDYEMKPKLTAVDIHYYAPVFEMSKK